MSQPLTAEQEQIVAKAFEWLQAYRTLVSGRPVTVPERLGSRYEAWSTLTIVYMLMGFSRGVFPMTQVFETVSIPSDFVLQVGVMLRVLEADEVSVVNE